MIEKKMSRLHYLIEKCRREKINISDVNIKYYRSARGLWSEREYDVAIKTLEKRILLNKLSEYKEIL